MKRTVPILFLVSMILIIMISLKGFSEDIEPYPDCFQYEGGLQKRGNVKDATRAFDLLLNGEYEEKDDIVSSSF